jgi:hypothetical protein
MIGTRKLSAIKDNGRITRFSEIIIVFVITLLIFPSFFQMDTNNKIAEAIHATTP